MSTEIQKQHSQAPATLKGLLENENIKKRFSEILKENANSFTANLSVMVSNSQMLSKCEPISVIGCAVVSASLNLPLDTNLGFAYIVPYGTKAQFQIGYKGLIQLALRTGQYKTIGVTEIYDGQLISENPLTGEYEFDFTKKKSNNIIGYAAYFKMLNGFEKTIYQNKDKVENHAKRFSQTYKRNSGVWVDDFDGMARKTVLKNLLSKWGYLSIELQSAVKYDQSMVKNEDLTEFEYVDNKETVNTEKEMPITDLFGENEIK